MRELAASIRDLVQSEPLTILAGAGCSVAAPSCLPAGKTMTEALIRHACPASEADTLLGLDDLRFEELVETFTQSLDPDFHVLDCFAQCDRPNDVHFFIADYLRQGHFVVTTNFDCLIERALVESGTPPADVRPVITREDFERYGKADDVHSVDRPLVVKVHGSTENFVTSEGTRQSLIATIRAFGSNRQGLDIFRVEPFKQQLLERLFDDRTVLVLGYSGSDDFDIVPTLCALRNLRRVVWVNHVSGATAGRTFEFDGSPPAAGASKVDRILYAIAKRTPRVFRIDVDTASALRALVPSSHPTATTRFSLNLPEWLEKQIERPPEMVQHAIAYKIYHSKRRLGEAAVQCLKVLALAEAHGLLTTKAEFLNNLASIYQAQLDESQALRAFEQAIAQFESLGDRRGAATVRANRANMYMSQSKYSEVLKEYEAILPLIEAEPVSDWKAVAFSNLGAALVQMDRLREGLERMVSAVSLADELGDLSAKARLFGNMGDAYARLGNDEQADTYLKAALRLHEELYEEEGQADVLWIMAVRAQDRGDLQTSLAHLEKGSAIAGRLPGYARVQDYFSALGDIYVELGRFSDAYPIMEHLARFPLQRGDYAFAIEMYVRILPIAEKSSNVLDLIDARCKLALAYEGNGEPEKALLLYAESIPVLEKAGDLEGVATMQNSVGGCQLSLGNFEQARDAFASSLETLNRLAPVPPKAITLMNLGLAELKLANFKAAIERLDEARASFELVGEQNSDFYRSTVGHLAFARRLKDDAERGVDTSQRLESIRVVRGSSGVTGSASEASALLAEGRRHLSQSNFVDARRCFEHALSDFHRLGLARERAMTHMALGELEAAQAHHHEAIAQFAGAQREFEQLGDYENCFQARHAMGTVHQLAGAARDAVECFKLSLDALSKVDNETARREVGAQVVEKIAALSASLEPDEGAAWVKVAAGNAVQSRRYRDAAKYFDLEIELRERTSQREELGLAYGNAGNARRILGEYAAAMARLETALRIFRELDRTDYATSVQRLMDEVRAKL